MNLTGIMNGIGAFVPRMRARGVPAHVVNTGSMSGFLAAPMLGAYSATKFAVRALTEALHHDLRHIDACVQVSLLAPGAVRDHMRRGTQEAGMDPAEVARLVLEAIRAERFWIFPHPEMLAPLPEMTAAIIAGRWPEFGLAKSWKLEGE